MIKIINPILQNEILLDSQAFNILCLESPKFLSEFVQQVLLCLDGEESEVRFVENSQAYKNLSKISFIANVFDFDFNSKKMQNALVKSINEKLFQYEYELNEIYVKMYSVFQKVIDDFCSEIAINEDVDKALLIKLFAPTIQDSFKTLLERIVAYINIAVEFLDLKCIMFLHLQEFLSKEDITQLFEHCRYKDVAVLLIESRHKYHFQNEKCLVIDDDLCKIIE